MGYPCLRGGNREQAQQCQADRLLHHVFTGHCFDAAIVEREALVLQRLCARTGRKRRRPSGFLLVVRLPVFAARCGSGPPTVLGIRK